MNFQKYSTTNISGTAGTAQHFSNLNQSMGYVSNSSMKRQSSGNTRQEQSVERLKSCIADLKKLASNKVKRQTNNYVDQAPSFGDQQTPSSSSQYGYDGRSKPDRNSQYVGTKSKSKNQQYDSNYDQQQRKNHHQTKMANALKKYMNETEYTAAAGVNTSATGISKLDQNYRDMLSQVTNSTTGINTSAYHKSNTNDRRESHRGRSSANGSNKKKQSSSTTGYNQGSQRGHSATNYHHQREDSYSKKETALMGSNKKRGSASHMTGGTTGQGVYASQKKQLENSIRSNKYSDHGYSSKQQPRKAKSQDRIHPNYQQSDKPSPSNQLYSNNHRSQQNNSKSSRPQSSSTTNMQRQNQGGHSENLYPESYSALNKNSNLLQQKERKPFAFQSYLLNQNDIYSQTSASNQTKKTGSGTTVSHVNGNGASQPFSKTDTFLGGGGTNGSENPNAAIDIRIKNNKHGETDYLVIQSPTSQQHPQHSNINQPRGSIHSSNNSNIINLTDNKADIYGGSGKQNSRRMDSSTSNQYLQQQQYNTGISEKSQRAQSQNPQRPDTSHFGMKQSDSAKDQLNTTSNSNHHKSSGNQKVRNDFKQKSQDKSFDSKTNVYQKQLIGQAIPDPASVHMINTTGGIRSLQEAAILTQSTDFSENRIQSLEHQKRILSLQNQNPSSIYSNTNQPQFYPGTQNHLINQTTSSLQNQNIITYGYGQSTMGAGGVGINNMMRTANATREDFNIEDLHSQIVYKLQRSKKLIREIELLPQERDQEMMEDSSDFGSGRVNHNRYQQKQINGARGSNGGGPQQQPPQSLIIMQNEEIICGDGCNRPAIFFGRAN